MADDRKVWAFSHNGATHKIGDLPLAVVDRIAKDHNVNWAVIVDLPLSDLAVAQALARAAAAEHGIEDLPDSFTARSIVDFFDLVDDDVPDSEVPDIVVEGEPGPLSSGSETETPGE